LKHKSVAVIRKVKKDGDDKLLDYNIRQKSGKNDLSLHKPVRSLKENADDRELTTELHRFIGSHNLRRDQTESL